MSIQIDNIISKINEIPELKIYGRISAVKGLLIECAGITSILSVGSRCKIIGRNNQQVPAEVVGFRGETAMLMPYGDLDGIGVDCKVYFEGSESLVYPHESWVGRILNGFAEAVDNKGMLVNGLAPYHIKAKPPPAQDRNPVGKKLDLGVKAINTFTSLCYGQRMGIFAGSGVGKSVLISMMARYSKADVKVIGLIGERGREVNEFIKEYLGEEGLKSSVVIVATSDESALMRRQATYLTLTVCEYFRDQGKSVLCLMDSVTRFAMAQREIGLSIGEPPASKGYTPTVFAELPRLLERAGPGVGQGSITGLFSVLVEGDDHNEPVADAVRGILDGHIVLERLIAERGRFPAVNVLKSISRTMPHCNTAEQNSLVNTARALLSTYENMAELIRLGAYKKGSDPEVDNAIKYYPLLENFIKQEINENITLDECYAKLAEVLSAKK